MSRAADYRVVDRRHRNTSADRSPTPSTPDARHIAVPPEQLAPSDQAETAPAAPASPDVRRGSPRFLTGTRSNRGDSASNRRCAAGRNVPHEHHPPAADLPPMRDPLVRSDFANTRFLSRGDAMEGLGNRVQLVIAGQSAPGEGFATTPVHRVVNCLPHLLFDRDQRTITLHGSKGGTAASSVGGGEVGRWSCGTAANAPSSSRR